MTELFLVVPENHRIHATKARNRITPSYLYLSNPLDNNPFIPHPLSYNTLTVTTPNPNHNPNCYPDSNHNPNHYPYPFEKMTEEQSLFSFPITE